MRKRLITDEGNFKIGYKDKMFCVEVFPKDMDRPYVVITKAVVVYYESERQFIGSRRPLPGCLFLM
jgi:hypothetical protein